MRESAAHRSWRGHATQPVHGIADHRDLKEALAGAKVVDLVRKHGISEHTFYRWKAKYGGMEVSDARRLKQLEDENRRLKTAVADLTLDNQALKAVLGKR
jgi:putative transposase